MDTLMAERLTGIDRARAEEILTDLTRNNFFTEKRLYPDPVYQYHPLFREFLLSKAKERFTHTVLSAFQKEAAAILRESGRVEDAYVLFRDANDWGGIITLIMQHAPTLVSEGRVRVLEEWITCLPHKMLDETPWSLYWLSVCRTHFNPSQGYSYAERAFHLFREQKDAAGVFLAWAAAVFTRTYLMVELRNLDWWIEILHELVQEYGAIPSEEIDANVSTSMVFALILRKQNHPEFDYWTGRALSLMEKYGDINTRARIFMHIYFRDTFFGDFARSKVSFNSLRKLARSKGLTPLSRLCVKWAEVIYYVFSNEYEECLKTVSESIELSKATGITVTVPMIIGHGALCALNEQDFPTAERLLKEMAAFTEDAWLLDQCFYHYLMSHKAFLQGDIGEARGSAETALKLGDKVGFPVSESLIHIQMAFIMNELKEYAKASYHLDCADAITQRIRVNTTIFYIKLARAFFALEAINKGEEETGLSLLRNAMAYGREHGYFNTYTWYPGVMSRLCFKALEEGIEIEYVHSLVRKHKITPETPPIYIDSWPWPVKVYTLGRFGVLIAGRPLKFGRKAPHKVIEMLKIIISLGGRGLSKEQLTGILWPDADGDLAHKSLAINVHRLRSLFGLEEAIDFSDGRVTLNPKYCWVDIWAFERFLGDVEGAIKERQGYTPETIRKIEMALSMYQDDFLHADGDKEWAVSTRERLKKKLIQHLLHLGTHFEETVQFEKAVDCYNKGLQVDNLYETFYGRLMSCHQKLGQRTDAVRVYKSLRNILQTALGIEPSPKIQATYTSLLA